MKYKFFLVINFIGMGAFQSETFAMQYRYQKQEMSSSKKRKLRRYRAIESRKHNEFIISLVLKKLFKKKNEPSVIPLELWFPYDTIEIAQEKDVAIIENFNLPHRNGIIDPFGDFIEWKILFDDFL